MRERFRLEFIASIDHRHHTPGVPELPFNRYGDDRNEAGSRQLLEMHEVWRGVECGAVAHGSVRGAAMAVTQRPSGVGTFQFVVLASLRAAQLMRGCRPKVDGDHKAAVIAQLEVSEGKVVQVFTQPDISGEPTAIGEPIGEKAPV